VRDLYEILGVTADASDEEIKRSYRRKARQLHPDAGGDGDGFKELTTAYEVLKNPQARANYDRFGDPRGPSGAAAGDPFAGFGDLSDLIDTFFGGGGFGGGGSPRARQGGRDAIVDVALTLEEAAAGVRREIDVHLSRACEVCDGDGARPGTSAVTCSTCGGVGKVQQVTRSVFGQMLTTGTCPTCRGTGSRIAEPCEACGGEGRREVTEVVTVDVPAGVDDGTRLKLHGRGEAGRRGATSGDLYVRVRVAGHETFRRDGNDLHCELRIPMAQATLGAELKLPTLHGEEVVKVPAGTQTGHVLSLRRQGMPKLNGGGARGDLHVHCRVETPTRLTDEQVELLRRFAELRGEDTPTSGQGKGFLGRLRDAFDF
jgi:molecular chaperone DnaJ